MVSRCLKILCFCFVAAAGLGLVESPAAEAAGCYSSSYGYSSGYYTPTYYQTPVKVIIKERPYYVPVGFYGAVYGGPLSPSSVQSLFAKQTTQTISTTAAAAAAPAPMPPGVTASDFARLTRIVEGGFGGIKNDMAALEGRISARIGNMEGRLARAEARQAAIEAKLGMVPSPVPAPAGSGAAPPAPRPADAPAPKDRSAEDVKLPNAKQVYKAHCAACHQEGAKSDDPRMQKLITSGMRAVVLLTKAGEYAPISAEQNLALRDTIMAGKMPPPPRKDDAGKPDHNVPGMTEAEAFSALTAAASFPRKMAAVKDE